MTPDLPNVFADSGDIEYLQIPITDHWSQDLAVHFPAAIQFIGKHWRGLSARLPRFYLIRGGLSARKHVVDWASARDRDHIERQMAGQWAGWLVGYLGFT